MTGPFRRVASQAIDTSGVAETQFERQRGVDKVEVRRGLCAAHITGLASPVQTSRIAVLRAVANAGVSIDFLKLGQKGISFVVESRDSDTLARVLEAMDCTSSLQHGRCVVMVHAANMRDEEGLVAKIISAFMDLGVTMDHIGDMHDRVLVVTAEEGVDSAVTEIERRLVGQAL